MTTWSTHHKLFNITLDEFPATPYENNIFTHNGNPPLSHFTCDVSNAYSANSGIVNCTIHDWIHDNIKGEDTSSRLLR